MHQTVHNVLQTLAHTIPPQDMTQARDMIADALPTTLHTLPTRLVTILGNNPGDLAFSQDNYFNVMLIADMLNADCQTRT